MHILSYKLKMIKYLLLLAVTTTVLCAPAEDQVHIPVPYSFPFYSGTPLLTQATLTSTLHPFIMSSSTPRRTPITIPSSSGSMVVPAAPLSWVWHTRMDLLSSEKALLISRITLSLGTRRPICSTSSLLEEWDSVLLRET